MGIRRKGKEEKGSRAPYLRLGKDATAIKLVKLFHLPFEELLYSLGHDASDAPVCAHVSTFVLPSVEGNLTQDKFCFLTMDD